MLGSISNTTRKLVEEYQERVDSMSMLERAHFEDSIWGSLTPTEKKKANKPRHGRVTWLSALLGISQHGLSQRRTLLLAGVAADPLWHRIHNDKMATTTATRLLRNAKHRARQIRCTHTVALEEVLKEYDNLECGSARLRKKKPVRKTLWSTVRVAAEEYAKSKLSSIDPVAANQLMNDFKRDLRALTEEWQARITHYKQQERRRDVAEISRSDVIHACSTLAMDPPPPGHLVDLKLARKKQRQLGRLYHPDSHGGDESMRPKFEAVNDAYQLLVDYNNSLGELTVKFTVINGGK